MIEFDDQGWYQDMDQRQALMNFLDETANDDLLIVVFIHGWKRNRPRPMATYARFARCCATRGRARPVISRRVLGVYLSWRGRSLYGNWLWTNASFWTRKGAAFRVAVGSVREILAGYGRSSASATGRASITLMEARAWHALIRPRWSGPS